MLSSIHKKCKVLLSCMVVGALASCLGETTTNAALSSDDGFRFSSSRLPVSSYYSCKVFDAQGGVESCLYYTDFPDFLYNSVNEACLGSFEISECPENAVVDCGVIGEEWLDKQMFLYAVGATHEECPAGH